MADKPAQPAQGSTINPVDHLDDWISAREQKRDAGKEAHAADKAAPAEPAAPDAVEPAAAPPTTSWRDVVIGDDAEHGFFKGKPVPELIKSYQFTERAKQTAETERNEWRQRAETLQRERDAEAAARKVLAEQQQPSVPAADPYAQIEELWFTNPRQAAVMLREQTVAEARQIAEKETAKYRQETAAETQRIQYTNTAERAYNQARDVLKLAPEVWERRAEAVLVGLVNPRGPYAQTWGPLNADNYVTEYNRLYGDAQSQPAQVVVAAAAPQAPNPPGSKKPAAAQQETTLPTLSEEERETYRVIAAATGGIVDPAKFIQRAERSIHRG